MVSFKKRLLNELCEINIGKTPLRANSLYWGTGRNWLSIADLKRKYVSFTKEQITELAIEKCNMKIIPKNTVVMSFKLSLGKLAIVQDDIYSNEAIASFPIKNKDELLPEYLYYALKTVDLKKYADKAAKGITLNKKKLNMIQIPYTDIDTQKKVVEILNSAEILIQNRQAQIIALDELIQSIFYKTFGDLFKNPYEFKKVQLDFLLKEPPQNGMYKPSTDYCETEGTPILRIDSFYKGKITKLDELKRIKSTELEIKKYRLNINDIVINRVNSIEYLGKCGLVETLNEDTVFESNMMKLRINDELVNPKYLTHVLSSAFIHNQILKKAKHSVNQSSINQTDVKSFEIILPPINLQNEYASKIIEIEKHKSVFVESLKDFNYFYHACLAKSFKSESFKEYV
ncbi:restriction endonuclease subunit S [Priestia aryabhattai]|uniref:Restriction endonuclease subunit S n=1 Tax=Priestia aryabhattai TaxID=412384 RepID=A0ABD5KZI6_PRIAR